MKSKSEYAKLKRAEYREKNKDLTYSSTELVSKVCTKCKEERLIRVFRIDKARFSGFESRCRDCNNKDNRDRAGVLNPDIKRRPKIKCYSCGEIKSKRRFNALASIDRGRQYWCRDCISVVKGKKQKRQELKTYRDKLSVSSGRPCKKCSKYTVNKGKNKLCQSCTKIKIKERRAKLDRDTVKERYNAAVASNKTKTCSKCSIEKAYGDFYINHESVDHAGYNCKECSKEQRKKNFRDNREAYRDRHREYKRENRVRVKRRHKEAKVAWGDTTAIRLIYKEMRRLNKEAGYVKFHVDHKIPLHHPSVCGLHVEHNLQIILATDNEIKGNSFTPGLQ